MIATDYAPHTVREKVRLPHMGLGLRLSRGRDRTAADDDRMADGRLSFERFVTISSAAPARAFGLYGRKGR